MVKTSSITIPPGRRTHTVRLYLATLVLPQPYRRMMRFTWECTDLNCTRIVSGGGRCRHHQPRA